MIDHCTYVKLTHGEINYEQYWSCVDGKKERWVDREAEAQ